MARKTDKALDLQIDKFYYIHAEGLQINIMDINKLYTWVKSNYNPLRDDLESVVKAAVAIYCTQG